MWIRTSSVLLATLVVSGLSFPHPDDAEYRIPEVGTGQRSQYYVLHDDGTFKYGFDSGDGAYESVKSHSLGDLHGKFGYVDPDGKTIRLEYESGVGGFVARGDHLPKPSPELAQALASVVRSNKPFIDPLAGSGAGSGDASYGFRFKSDDHSRNEESDSEGTVTGSYSYVDENGVTRSFNYKAGKGIGFVITGDGLTQEVNTVTQSVRRPAVRASHRTTQQQTSFKSTARKTPKAPSRQFGAAYRASTSGSYTGQQADISTTRSQTPGDASYSFSYNTGDHSRSESSDPNLNVDGSFSFVADDGNKRTVNYVAGSSTGFQAQGDHLPKAPVANFGSRITGATRRSQSTHKTQSSSHHYPPSRGSLASQRQASISRSTGGHSQTATSRGQSKLQKFAGDQRKQTSTGASRASFSSATQRGSSPSLKRTSFNTAQRTKTVALPKRTYEEANTRSSSSPDGSYSFAYDTSSHSRSESGDDGNVVGNFAFVAEDDGQRRELNYEAGSETGFIAEGIHLPIGPIVPGAPSGQPTGRLVRLSSVPFVDPLADGDSDASYNFGFESDTYSRTETADEDGNRVGTYTIVEEDGTAITYRFKAGKGIGFETEEISRTKGPRPVKPTPYSGPLASDYQISSAHTSRFGNTGHASAATKFNAGAVAHRSSSKTGSGITRHVSQRPQTYRATHGVQTSTIRKPTVTSSNKLSSTISASSAVPFVDPLADGDSDASYNFGFESDTYSRTETADEDGNVVGTYTIVEEDGTAITYRFKAGKGIGFETEEISRTQGPRPVRPIPYSGPLASDYQTSSAHTSRFGTTGHAAATATTKFNAGVGTHSSSSRNTDSGTTRHVSQTSQTAYKAGGQSSTLRKPTITSYKSPSTFSTSSASRKVFPSTKSTFKHSTHGVTQSGTKSSFTPSTILKSSFKPTRSEELFPGFTLHSYNPSPSAHKFGYVLKFDD